MNTVAKSSMAGLEELRKKLVPLFDAEKGFSSGSTLDPCDDSYTVIFLNWIRNFELVFFCIEIVCFCEAVGRWDCEFVE